MLICQKLRDRVISTKFLTRRVSLQNSHPKKMSRQTGLYLENRARQSNFNENFDPPGISAE